MNDYHLITEKELATFGATKHFESRLKAFINQQKSEWDLAHRNFKALAIVDEKTFEFDGFNVRTQHNPDRIRSSAARTDKKSISERPCFLCSDKFMPGQKALEYNENYLILCNPFPIFPEHLTIPTKKHQPQQIRESFDDLLKISRDFIDFTVFYNGPQCGASAPDHMHFQAGTFGFMPIDKEFDALPESMKTILVRKPEIKIIAVDDKLRRFIVLESDNKNALTKAFNTVYEALEEKDPSKDEPKMNILAHYNKRWRINIFPRDRQHPDCFYAEDNKRIIIGPASVELGGIAILPRTEDFQKIRKADLKQIYRQITINEQDFDELKTKLQNQEQPVLQVGIMAKSELQFQLNGCYFSGKKRYTESTGLIAKIKAGKIVLIENEENSTEGAEITFIPENVASSSFTLKKVTIGVGFHWQQNQDQQFRGSLKLIVENNKIRVINIVPLEEYLRSVISSEMSAKSSMELLKAHAVISRSWLLAQIKKKQSMKKEPDRYKPFSKSEKEIVHWYDREDHNGFDVCADDHCQRYQGISKIISEKANRAVDETFGLVLTSEGQICDARFSKCCGGISESFENVWEPVSHPYLKSIIDNSSEPNGFITDLRNEEAADKWIRNSPPAFCNTYDQSVLSQILPDFDQHTKDFYRWKVEYSQEQLALLIKEKSNIDFGQIICLEPLERGYSGRLIRLRIKGTKQTMIIGKELEIRKTLSKTHLYSSAFVIDHLHIENNIPQKFVFTGAGWGHGVGLCQIGAAMMGEKGFSFENILKHYFRSSQLIKYYK